MVARETPRVLAMAATVMSRRSFNSLAVRILSGVMTVGRPPRRPRARAAARPAAVRSWMRSRSNSAMAPMMWNSSLPPGVVVSSCSDRLRSPTPRSPNAAD